MFFIESDQDVWNMTLSLSWELDRKGKVLPVTDLHIAAYAQKISAVVLTYDAHFNEIPDLFCTQDLY
jgi:predicted nucleic acid-binding protein